MAANARRFWAEKTSDVRVQANRPHDSGHSVDGVKHTPHDSGLSVGVADSALVQELQDEVRLLTERISSDSQRFADYENEIHALRTQLKQERNKANAEPEIASPITRPQTPGLSRFGSFMRKPVASPEAPVSRERELESALTLEQAQRAAAEKKIHDMDAEIEELSTTLFQQANDMVSTERRENAALKDRINTLEEHEYKVTSRLRALEQREIDRKRRMEKLESAILRIEKARALLIPR